MGPSASRASLALNVALYYVGWIACVSGAATGYWIAGALLGLSLFAAHLLLATEPAAEARLALSVGVLGTAVDSVQTALGLLVFDTGQLVATLAPLWIVIMWLLFAATLRYAFQWLIGRPYMSALLGALGGPSAFYAGKRIGAIDFHPTPGLTLVVLAAVWCVLLPALMWLAARTGGPGRYRFLDR